MGRTLAEKIWADHVVRAGEGFVAVPEEDYPRSNNRVEFWEHMSGQQSA